MREPSKIVVAVQSLTALAAVGALIVSLTALSSKVNEKLERSLLESCQRLDILRAEDNVSHLADYRVFSAVSKFEGLDGLTPIVKQAVRQKSWIPITNCTQAVNLHGTAYRAPGPIPFYIRMPPSSALHYP